MSYKPDYHVDRLAELSEEDLYKQFYGLKTVINKSYHEREDTMCVEVDMCYVQREIEVRQRRNTFRYDKNSPSQTSNPVASQA